LIQEKPVHKGVIMSIRSILIVAATLVFGSISALGASGSITFTQANNLNVSFVFNGKGYGATISGNCQNAVARNLGKQFSMSYDGRFPSGSGANVYIGNEQCHLYSIR
jgi:hypothetical protein